MNTAMRVTAVLAGLAGWAAAGRLPGADGYLWATAHEIPKHTTSEGSGYFSIVEGRNGRLYIGTAKYGANGYLVEFDPQTARMQVVVDAMQAIGSQASGFAAQAKIHTRNNVGESGRIYFGTKQGYPKQGEQRTDYPGGYPMVYDPATGKTRIYDIPVRHQGVISVTPDEARGAAYVSTCSDERPVESAHFLRLDLETGQYRSLLDCRHMYAFIVVDWRHRAYHPVLGGKIARFDPAADKLDQLEQTIDGEAPSRASLLAHPESHPINWDITPDRRTLYAVAMSGNQLYAYDLAADGDKLAGRSLGKLLPWAEKTDCRALCVGPQGTVWAAVWGQADKRQGLHLVSYRPGAEGAEQGRDRGPRDHGPLAIRNPDYTQFVDADGKPHPWHHGMRRLDDGTLVPLYHMGVCASAAGKVYLTAIYPYTLLEIDAGQVAASPVEK